MVVLELLRRLRKKRKAKNISNAAKEQRDKGSVGVPAYASGAFNEDPLDIPSEK